MQCDSDEILVPDSDTKVVPLHLAVFNAAADLYLWKNRSTDDDAPNHLPHANGVGVAMLAYKLLPTKASRETALTLLPYQSFDLGIFQYRDRNLPYSREVQRPERTSLKRLSFFPRVHTHALLIGLQKPYA